MGRPPGSKNRITRYGANELPKKCRYCGEQGSTVRRKKDHVFQDRIHTVRRRSCHECGKIWVSNEMLDKKDHPELFSR